MSLTVRPAILTDAAAIRAIYAPIVEHTAISFEETVPTEAEMAQRIADYSASHAFLVAERDGRVVGYAYGSTHRARAAYRFSVEVTAYVADEARGSGVGKVLYGELLPTLNAKGFHAAFAGVALPNPASIALHRSAGFEPLGVFREVGFKLGHWHDVAWLQRVLN
jgi:L-amino acid N-acyltransferase YncA